MLIRLGRGMNSVSSAPSPFSFASLADLVFWINPADGSTITQSSNLVSQINDLSSNGFHATSISADRPLTNAATMNGQNALSFDGTTFLTSDSLSTYPNGNDKPFSMHLTFKANSTAGTQVIAGFGVSSGANPLFWFGISGGNFTFTKRDDSGLQSITTIAAADLENHTVSILHTGLAVTIWLDGLKVIDSAASDVGLVSLNQFTIGALRRNIGEEQNFTGLIGEILVFNRFNSLSETKTIQNILMDKWTGLPKAYDFFLIAGQSNAEGRGASASAPAVTKGAGYLADGAGNITALADPVGGAITGSAWPAFANEWFARTGRSAVFIEQATGGAGLLAATGSPNWSTTGTLYGASVTAANNALSDLANIFTPDISSINVLWAQGETDAVNINGTTITAALYQTELETLIANYKTDLGINYFFISEIGRQNDGLLDTEHSDIGNAQLSAAANISYAYVVFADAKYFPEESKMTDNLHYNQAGLNEMGTIMARAASNPLALFTPEFVYTLATWHSDETIVDNSGIVNTWSDKSGNAINVTEFTNPPAFVSGMPDAVRFDGSNDGLQYSGALYSLSPMWMVAFHNPDTTNQATQIIAGNQGSGVSKNRAYMFNQGVDFGDTNLLHPSPVSGSYIIQAARVEGTGITTQYISLNGGAETSGSVTRNGIASNFSIGQYAVLGGFHYDGDLSEVLTGLGAFYGKRREKIEGYLAHKYGMTSILPSGHPYKSSPPLVQG
ncbi:MAG: sialate O-acetylesterase [Alphaproteobacteria bacterium]|nr:sialate O-acetylesterase [Alphaproteobacteria bacterium]